MGRYPEDPRLAEARALALPELADALGLELRRTGSELVGPCPDCGGDDRFAISVPKNIFNCRKCGAKGDAIALVMLAKGCEFPAALDYLCGAREMAPDRQELERRRRKAADARAARERAAARYRAAAIAAAREIWRESREDPAQVGAYLSLRGITLSKVPRCLRYHPALPRMVEAPEGRRAWREVHRGPAMVAAVQGPDDRLCAVHRTWFDLTRPRGKALIRDGAATLKVKESRGSIKGGAIRLWTPPGATVLVMGEGIETTLTARVAGPEAWAYWCGVSLGNMAGQRERGPGMKFAGRPDLRDRAAFVPPAWVRRLIFVQDGDSDPRMTRAQLEAGLRRAMLRRPGLTGAIVHAGEGRDLNDIVMEAQG